ncbi:MAG TPA: hypothetical protein DDZ76_08575 [Xanthomonadales bacterium]|nr:hypothetical protein [Xanthomonadales bacterium]
MAKTLSFAAVHTTIAFAVGYAFTGSIWAGGVLALVEPACNTLAFHLHERIWARRQGRREPTDRALHRPAPGAEPRVTMPA